MQSRQNTCFLTVIQKLDSDSSVLLSLNFKFRNLVWHSRNMMSELGLILLYITCSSFQIEELSSVELGR